MKELFSDAMAAMDATGFPGRLGKRDIGASPVAENGEDESREDTDDDAGSNNNKDSEDSSADADTSADEYADELGMTQKLAGIRAHIRLLYLLGRPLFTRSALQDLSRQLRALRTRQLASGEHPSIFVEGLDGVVVEQEIETGRVIPASNWHAEGIHGDPCIYYCSIQSLVSKKHQPPLNLAYCSLQICHPTLFQHPSTKDALRKSSEPGLAESPEEDSAQVFKTNRQMWDTSEECRLLTSLMESITPLPHITRIIAFACGSIRNDCTRTRSPRSSYQHALILTLRDILLSSTAPNSKESPGLRTVTCCAQEPVYDEADEAILKEHGIFVLEDPDGFLQVDESTLVISCAPNVPVKQVTLDLARPAAMIWNRIEKERNDGLLWTDPDSSRMRIIISEFYDTFEFPGSEENFGDVVLYVRRQADADTPRSAIPVYCPP